MRDRRIEGRGIRRREAEVERRESRGSKREELTFSALGHNNTEAKG